MHFQGMVSISLLFLFSRSLAINPRVAAQNAWVPLLGNVGLDNFAWDPQGASINHVGSFRNDVERREAAPPRPPSKPITVQDSKSPSRQQMLNTPRKPTAKELAATKPNNQCKKLVDCKCPTPYGSCLNGKCLCGDANKDVAKVANAFVVPVLEGLGKAMKEVQKVVGGLTFAIKTALALGSWAIPGLGKTAAKLLNEAIPLTETGNKDADKIMGIITKII